MGAHFQVARAGSGFVKRAPCYAKLCMLMRNSEPEGLTETNKKEAYSGLCVRTLTQLYVSGALWLRSPGLYVPRAL